MSGSKGHNRSLNWFDEDTVEIPAHIETCPCEHCQYSDRRGRCVECGNHVTVGSKEYGHAKDCSLRPSGVDAYNPGGNSDEK